MDVVVMGTYILAWSHQLLHPCVSLDNLRHRHFVVDENALPLAWVQSLPVLGSANSSDIILVNGGYQPIVPLEVGSHVGTPGRHSKLVAPYLAMRAHDTCPVCLGSDAVSI